MREGHPAIKNNFKIRESRLSPEIQQAALEHLKAQLFEDYETAKLDSVPIDEMLGEGASEKLNKAQKFFKDEFKNRGIQRPLMRQALFKKQNMLESGKGATAYATHIEMFNLDIGDKELKQLVVFKTLFHEMYHFVSNFSISIEFGKLENDELGIKINTNAAGAGYNEAVSSSALEEGAAVSFENQIFEKIRKLFSKETLDKYDSLIQSGFDNFPRDKTYVTKDSLHIISSNDGEPNGFNENYIHPLRLVKYLESQIPDFNTKLEKLRVNRESLELARSIEARFGEGMFRKIVTCKVGDAETLINELK